MVDSRKNMMNLRSIQRQPILRTRAYASVDDSDLNWSPSKYLQIVGQMMTKNIFHINSSVWSQIMIKMWPMSTKQLAELAKRRPKSHFPNSYHRVILSKCCICTKSSHRTGMTLSA